MMRRPGGRVYVMKPRSRTFGMAGPPQPAPGTCRRRDVCTRSETAAEEVGHPECQKIQSGSEGAGMWCMTCQGRGDNKMPSLASFCLILRSTSQNITKKPQNDRKNGPKMVQK